MGADFLIAFVDLLDADSRTVRELCNIWTARIDNLCLSDSADYFDDYSTPEELRDSLRSAAASIFSAVKTGNRFTSEFRCPGLLWRGKSRVLLMSGGLSWGDCPSDAYEQMSLLESYSISDPLLPSEELILLSRLNLVV